MNIAEYSETLSSDKGHSSKEWAQALSLVKSDAGRARMTVEKLDTLIEACKSPKDLETAFTVILELHREDREMEDGWIFLQGKIAEVEFSLPAWCRAIESLNAYLEKNRLKAPTADCLEYILCTTESPEIKNGKAPLVTAVSHYLDEYGLVCARPIT